eukprot:6469208-Lingulodinium_polyedra.AAC.1
MLRLLRKKWKTHYKSVLASLKKDPAKYKRSVLQHRMNNQGKKKRSLAREVGRMTQTTGHRR